MELKTIYIIAHLFGVVLGAGGAYISDYIFFRSVRNGRVSANELRFLELTSHIIWIGLSILFVTGILLFLTNPGQYLSSAKFLAKMTLVLIIFVNGLIFHLFHIPYLTNQRKLMRHIPILLFSGAISGVSWTGAIILGALRDLPYSYGAIMAFYILTIAVVFTVLFLNRKFIFNQS